MTTTLIDREGQGRPLVADDTDMTLMEAIRESDFEDTFAICSGCLSCATCHVILDEASFTRLLPIAEDEEALLSGVDGRQPTSRLSCQVPCGPGLEGAVVTVAPL